MPAHVIPGTATSKDWVPFAQESLAPVCQDLRGPQGLSVFWGQEKKLSAASWAESESPDGPSPGPARHPRPPSKGRRTRQEVEWRRWLRGLFKEDHICEPLEPSSEINLPPFPSPPPPLSPLPPGADFSKDATGGGRFSDPQFFLAAQQGVTPTHLFLASPKVVLNSPGRRRGQQPSRFGRFPVPPFSLGNGAFCWKDSSRLPWTA